jgi:hypothetical protein
MLVAKKQQETPGQPRQSAFLLVWRRVFWENASNFSALER